MSNLSLITPMLIEKATKLPVYVYSPKSNRFYERATGRFVSEQTIESFLDAMETQAYDTIHELSGLYLENEIPPELLHYGSMQALRDLHLQGAAMGAGGFEQLTQDDYDRIEVKMREDARRFAKFIQDMPGMTEAAIRNRINMYLGNARTSFYRSKRKMVTTADQMVIERRILTPGDNCEWCVHLSGLGWQEYGRLPVPGESHRSWDGSSCYTNCRCRMQQKKIKKSQRDRYIKKQLQLWKPSKSFEVNACGLEWLGPHKVAGGDQWMTQERDNAGRFGNNNVATTEDSRPFYDEEIGKAVDAAISMIVKDKIKAHQANKAAKQRYTELLKSGDATPEELEAALLDIEQAQAKFDGLKTSVADSLPDIFGIDDTVTGIHLELTADGDEIADTLNQAMDDFEAKINTLIQQDVIEDDFAAVCVIQDGIGRAGFYPDTLEMLLYNETSGIKSIAHEFGHLLEWGSAPVHDGDGNAYNLTDYANAFLVSRSESTVVPANGGDAQSIFQYGETERALKDSWVTPYVGKIYTESRNQQTGNSIRATEVISVGLERIFTDPTDFWYRDQAHFIFMGKVLNGSWRDEVVAVSQQYGSVSQMVGEGGAE